jgi:hypothetical protein
MGVGQRRRVTPLLAVEGVDRLAQTVGWDVLAFQAGRVGDANMRSEWLDLPGMHQDRGCAAVDLLAQVPAGTARRWKAPWTMGRSQRRNGGAPAANTGPSTRSGRATRSASAMLRASRSGPTASATAASTSLAVPALDQRRA